MDALVYTEKNSKGALLATGMTVIERPRSRYELLSMSLPHVLREEAPHQAMAAWLHLFALEYGGL